MLLLNNGKLFGFAFTKRNISYQTLYCLRNIDCCYLLWGEKSINKYLEFLLEHQPEFILGLGIYTGRDQKKIRIETKCSNGLSKTDINPFLKPYQNSIFAESIGNSFCNLASWKIMELINLGNLKSRYTFLHLPKSMAPSFAVEEIESMIKHFRSEQNQER